MIPPLLLLSSVRENFPPPPDAPLSSLSHTVLSRSLSCPRIPLSFSSHAWDKNFPVTRILPPTPLSLLSHTLLSPSLSQRKFFHHEEENFPPLHSPLSLSFSLSISPSLSSLSRVMDFSSVALWTSLAMSLFSSTLSLSLLPTRPSLPLFLSLPLSLFISSSPRSLSPFFLPSSSFSSIEDLPQATPGNFTLTITMPTPVITATLETCSTKAHTLTNETSPNQTPQPTDPLATKSL